MLRQFQEIARPLPDKLAASSASPPASEEIVPPPAVPVSPYFRWQPVLGWLIAAALTPLVLPVICLLAGLVRLTSRGPGFYGQTRVGKSGKHFRLWKLRTMRADAESRTGPVWTEENDPRITPLGRLLRKLHLDELPQLLNVLAGQMTLIGPRPERPEFTQHLARSIPGYLDRIQVLPGITGLSQINLPPDTDLDSVRRKLVLDRLYIESADLWFDLRIMLCTGLKMLGLPGLTVAKYLGLLRTPRIPAWMKVDQRTATVPVTYGRAVRHLHHAAPSSPDGNGQQHARGQDQKRSGRAGLQAQRRKVCRPKAHNGSQKPR